MLHRCGALPVCVVQLLRWSGPITCSWQQEASAGRCWLLLTSCELMTKVDVDPPKVSTG
jgi:hypothetical protein